MLQNKIISVRRVTKREPRQFVLQEKLDGWPSGQQGYK